MNDFKTLNANFNDTDEDIKIKYLNLLKKYPPESNKNKFIEIKTAYENLKTKLNRYNKYIMFSEKNFFNNINFDLLKKELNIGTQEFPKLKKIINSLKLL